MTEGESGNVFEQCKWATEQEVLGTIGGNLTLFVQENLFRELHKLEELVTPVKQSACGADKRCESFADLPPPQWKGGASFNTFDGGLYVASKFSDYFYFKAMAGLPLEERLGLQGAVELFGISNSMHKVANTALCVSLSQYIPVSVVTITVLSLCLSLSISVTVSAFTVSLHELRHHPNTCSWFAALQK